LLLVIFIGIACRQSPADLLGRKASLLQKTRLPRALSKIPRPGVAETLDPGLPRAVEPPWVRRAHEISRRVFVNAALNKLVEDFQRTLTTPCALIHELLGETTVGEKALALERIQDRRDHGVVESLRFELALEFPA
jgi:hypothetical protein